MDGEIQNPHINKPLLITIVLIVSLFILVVGAAVVWARQYDDRIGPHVSLGTNDLSGLTRVQAKELLQKKTDAILTEGIPLSTNQTASTEKLTFSSVVDSDAIEDIEFLLDETVEKAFTVSHEKNMFANAYKLLINQFATYELSIALEINRENIKRTVYELFPKEETLAKEPEFVFTAGEQWTVDVVDGSPGTEFAFDPFFKDLKAQLERLNSDWIEIQLVSRIPTMTNIEARSQMPLALQLIGQAPITFSYTDPATTLTRTWILTPADLAKTLQPNTGSSLVQEERFNTFLDTIAHDIERAAQDARIDVENGRVVNFVQSKQGIVLDREAMYDAFVQTMHEQVDEPTLAVLTIEQKPHVETGDVNDLGITDILGVGTSSYRGSPQNRRLNIQNGVRLLNGLLIPPGETFSLISALQPFTQENGYLAELVIKGDRIEPELGGGLCQIGTTTFRAVMNSGLPVVERRNHSIVVSYYNDPSNKNPGTDATIYEPAPDLKFTNDTSRYLLLQAENDTAKQELRFTFWGTTDGRSGSYTPPVVQRWIPVGETKYIETLNLKPGEEKCQEAHIGADASFTYTIVRPDGTEEATTFDSHYRPLPKICLVGVEKLTEEVVEETPNETPEPPAENLSPNTP